MPLIDKAISNTSNILRLDPKIVSSEINDLLGQSYADEWTSFFFLRSLSNQGNLSGIQFKYLQVEDKLTILRWYWGRHASLGLGNYYPTYEEVSKVFSPDFYRTKPSSSFFLYIRDSLVSEHILPSSDILFPRKNSSALSDFEKVWFGVSSLWISIGYKSMQPRKIGSFLANSYGITPSDKDYRHYLSTVTPNSLVEASKYVPALKRGKSWADYKKAPQKGPLPCLSPYGFDYMAFLMFRYLEDIRVTNLWANGAVDNE
jgi:hypothetical protein